MSASVDLDASWAGCRYKLPSTALIPVVRDFPGFPDSRLLVGGDTPDDAPVYKISDDLALPQTIRLFHPTGCRPRPRCRIAAANAPSDVYALGGSPFLALDVVAFPLETRGGDALHESLRGV